MNNTHVNPLAVDFNALSLIRFAFPSMVMMLFMGLYTIVDTMFVLRFVGTDALPSINIVCPVINIVFDYIFIVLMQMGVREAALGTGIGYMIPAIAGVVFFLSRKDMPCFRRGFRPFQTDKRFLIFANPVWILRF